MTFYKKVYVHNINRAYKPKHGSLKMAAKKKSMKAEINEKLDQDPNTVDVKKPKVNNLAGLVVYGDTEYLYWTPEGYKAEYPDNPEKWPVFKYRSYNAEDEAVLVEIMLKQNVEPDNAIRYFLTDSQTKKIIIKRCLMDVINLKDANGKDVKIKRNKDGVSENFLKRLPMKLMTELQAAIINSSRLSDEEQASLGF